MSSAKYAAPLLLELGPSRNLTGFLLAIYVAGYAALWTLPLPWFLPLLAGAPLYLNMRSTFKRYGTRNHPMAIRSVLWDAKGDWHLTRVDKSIVKAELMGDSFVHPALTVLNFRVVGNRRSESAVIVSDMIAANAFRQLRVRIKLGARNEAV